MAETPSTASHTLSEGEASAPNTITQLIADAETIATQPRASEAAITASSKRICVNPPDEMDRQVPLPSSSKDTPIDDAIDDDDDDANDAEFDPASFMPDKVVDERQFFSLTAEQAQAILRHLHDAGKEIHFPYASGGTIPVDEIDDLDEPQLRLSVFLSHAQAPCLRALFTAFKDADHGTANTPDASPEAADLHKLNKKVADMAAQLGTLSTAIRQDTAELRSCIAEVKTALTSPPQPAAPAPATSYANMVKQTDIANLMEDAARRGAAAHKTAIEEDLRSRSIVVRYFQVAQQPETDLMLAQRLYHSLIVGRLQLGNERIRIESAAWMAGQPGPIRVTFANVASKVKVLQARKLLGGKNAPSLDDLLSPAQLVIKNGLLGSDVAIKAKRELKKVYVRLVHDTPMLFINGQRTEAQAPNKRHKSGRPRPAPAASSSSTHVPGMDGAR
eukprot:jgi/Mesvir1/3838/Mv25853-RA.1